LGRTTNFLSSGRLTISISHSRLIAAPAPQS
jgi:hypothetical protein